MKFITIKQVSHTTLELLSHCLVAAEHTCPAKNLLDKYTVITKPHGTVKRLRVIRLTNVRLGLVIQTLVLKFLKFLKFNKLG